jgi:hypothetical protein
MRESICPASVLLLCFLMPGQPAHAQKFGAGLLTVWPTARSTALAGALTASADNADAPFFNPGGLGFQTNAKATLSTGEWLRGLWPGMCHSYGAFVMPLHRPLGLPTDIRVSTNAAYMRVGEVDVVNERGEFVGRYDAWRGAVTLSGGMQVGRLGLGLGATLFHSRYSQYTEFIWPVRPPLGLERGGTGTGFVVSAGLLYQAASSAALGLALTNIGPDIAYHDAYGWLGEAYSYAASMPRMLRLGVCWTPVNILAFRLRVMPEMDKLLIGLFPDTSSIEPLKTKLADELNSAWKALGIEATCLRLLHARVSYFEDVQNKRGGFVVEDEEGRTRHYSVCDIITRKAPGRLRKVGLCWGIGFGSESFRFDLSSDAAIYDFDTSNWKFSLVSNDLAGLVRGLRGPPAQ